MGILHPTMGDGDLAPAQALIRNHISVFSIRFARVNVSTPMASTSNAGYRNCAMSEDQRFMSHMSEVQRILQGKMGTPSRS